MHLYSKVWLMPTSHHLHQGSWVVKLCCQMNPLNDRNRKTYLSKKSYECFDADERPPWLPEKHAIGVLCVRLAYTAYKHHELFISHCHFPFFLSLYSHCLLPGLNEKLPFSGRWPMYISHPFNFFPWSYFPMVNFWGAVLFPLNWVDINTR